MYYTELSSTPVTALTRTISILTEATPKTLLKQQS